MTAIVTESIVPGKPVSLDRMGAAQRLERGQPCPAHSGRRRACALDHPNGDPPSARRPWAFLRGAGRRTYRTGAVKAAGAPGAP